MGIWLLLDHRHDLVAEWTRVVIRLRWQLVVLNPELERSVKRGGVLPSAGARPGRSAASAECSAVGGSGLRACRSHGSELCAAFDRDHLRRSRLRDQEMPGPQIGRGQDHQGRAALSQTHSPDASTTSSSRRPSISRNRLERPGPSGLAHENHFKRSRQRIADDLHPRSKPQIATSP